MADVTNPHHVEPHTEVHQQKDPATLPLSSLESLLAEAAGTGSEENPSTNPTKIWQDPFNGGSAGSSTSTITSKGGFKATSTMTNRSTAKATNLGALEDQPATGPVTQADPISQEVRDEVANFTAVPGNEFRQLAINHAHLVVLKQMVEQHAKTGLDASVNEDKKDTVLQYEAKMSQLTKFLKRKTGAAPSTEALNAYLDLNAEVRAESGTRLRWSVDPTIQNSIALQKKQDELAQIQEQVTKAQAYLQQLIDQGAAAAQGKGAASPGLGAQPTSALLKGQNQLLQPRTSTAPLPQQPRSTTNPYALDPREGNMPQMYKGKSLMIPKKFVAKNTRLIPLHKTDPMQSISAFRASCEKYREFPYGYALHPAADGSGDVPVALIRVASRRPPMGLVPPRPK